MHHHQHQDPAQLHPSCNQDATPRPWSAASPLLWQSFRALFMSLRHQVLSSPPELHSITCLFLLASPCPSLPLPCSLTASSLLSSCSCCRSSRHRGHCAPLLQPGTVVTVHLHCSRSSRHHGRGHHAPSLPPGTVVTVHLHRHRSSRHRIVLACTITDDVE